MSDNIKQIEAIRNLIIKNRLDEALIEMASLSTDHEILSNIDLTRASLASLNQQRLRGTLSFSEERIAQATIVNNILQILGSISSGSEGGKLISSKQDTVPKKILFLSACPNNMNTLRFGEEVKIIQKTLKMSGREASFVFEQCGAVEYDQISAMVRNKMPHILHISVHSSKTDGLLFQDANGSKRPVSGQILAKILERTSSQGHRIECVLLNACNSMVHAEALTEFTDFSIGMEDFIPDDASIDFTRGFYDVIIENQADFKQAFEEGQLAIQMEDIPKIRVDAQANHELPKLFTSKK